MVFNILDKFIFVSYAKLQRTYYYVLFIVKYYAGFEIYTPSGFGMYYIKYSAVRTI